MKNNNNDNDNNNNDNDNNNNDNDDNTNDNHNNNNDDDNNNNDNGVSYCCSVLQARARQERAKLLSEKAKASRQQAFFSQLTTFLDFPTPSNPTHSTATSTLTLSLTFPKLSDTLLTIQY